MHRSTERILTTHTGSLPRSPELTDMMYRFQEGVPADDEFWAACARAIEDAVRRQRDAGLDVINDGEAGKPGFANYVTHRLEGLGGTAETWGFHDMDEAPDLVELTAQQYEGDAGKHIMMPACVGDLRYTGHADAERDIEMLTSALGSDGVGNAFMTAPTPGCLAMHITNRHYPGYAELLMGFADAMREEYELIAGAGLTLQLDSPDLPTAHPGHGKFWMTDVIEELGYREWLELQLEALNRATADIPPDQMRLHLCWSNYKGPHHHDVPLREVIEPVLEHARPNTISFEAANPRHVHEWAVFRDLEVPDDKILMPGVIDTLTNFVEHPEAVAQRIESFAGVVGRERVIASTDCGFGTFAGFGEVVPTVAWRKLASLSEGAAIASRRLW